MTQTEMDDRNLMIENLTGHARAKKGGFNDVYGKNGFYEGFDTVDYPLFRISEDSNDKQKGRTSQTISNPH